MMILVVILLMDCNPYHVSALMDVWRVDVSLIGEQLLEEFDVVCAHRSYAFSARLNRAAGLVDIVAACQECGILFDGLNIIVRFSDGRSTFPVHTVSASRQDR